MAFAAHQKSKVIKMIGKCYVFASIDQKRCKNYDKTMDTQSMLNRTFHRCGQQNSPKKDAHAC